MIATGETHTVGEFLQLALARIGIKDWQAHFKHNPAFDRLAEVDLLIGDASKAKKFLKWEPTVNFVQLVNLMVDAEIAILSGKAKMSDF